MDKSEIPAQMRDKLEKLFFDAGYTVPELLKYMDDLERRHKLLEEEARKLRLAAARKTPSAGTMNSRLRDALRE